MNITNFNRIRINDTDNFLDIEGFGGHSNYGVMATAYEFASKKIEIRRKDRQIAMFLFEFSDLEIPDYWKDAEVIFSKTK
jgi:hypothetical protein